MSNTEKIILNAKGSESSGRIIFYLKSTEREVRTCETTDI